MLNKFFVLLLLFSALGSNAATINAASTSYADVSAAISSASNGDTVTIPSGTSEWSSNLAISKAITLQGAGTNSTIIQDNVTAGNHLITWTVVNNYTSRMTGIQFTLGTRSEVNYLQLIKVDGGNTNSQAMRIDNCFFNRVKGGIILWFSAKGVFDHNLLYAHETGIPAAIGYVKWNSSYGTAWGDGSWHTNNLFGTDDFVFFEDNIFTNTYAGNLTGIDGQAGGRFVFRKNTIGKLSFEAHGLEAARERSIRAAEIYDNEIIGVGDRDNLVYGRGGVWLVYSNRVRGWGTPAKLALLNNRMVDALASPFGGADGRNPWDVNSSPSVAGTASSAGTLTVTDSGKSWTTDQWAGYTVRKTSGIAVSSISRSGSTITVDTSSAHGFTNNQPVSIWSTDTYTANSYAYSSTYRVTVSDSDTFTVTTQFTPSSPPSGTFKVCAGNYFSEISANTATQLTFKDSIYTSLHDGYRMRFSASDTFEILKVDNAMDQPGRAEGSLVSGDTPTIPVGWNNQITSMCYEWANTNLTDNSDIDWSSIHGSIVPGVHTTNDYAFSYTSYTYPHPMVSGESPAEPAQGGRPPRLRGIRLSPR